RRLRHRPRQLPATLPCRRDRTLQRRTGSLREVRDQAARIAAAVDREVAAEGVATRYATRAVVRRFGDAAAAARARLGDFAQIGAIEDARELVRALGAERVGDDRLVFLVAERIALGAAGTHRTRRAAEMVVRPARRADVPLVGDAGQVEAVRRVF